MVSTPFVVGQWVRGDRFYGRQDVLDEIIDGPRNSLWLLGTRRVGKTSVLKQVENIAASAPVRLFLPVFWDLQGCDDPEELHAGFSEALLDAEEDLDRVGIDLEVVDTGNVFSSVSVLRRELRKRGLRLLLLCDETEELIKLNRGEPALLRRLRRVMQSHDDVRTVIASSIRLWALTEQQNDTSPFLHGFVPPLYIRPLSDEDADALIRQDQFKAEARPSFDDRTIETIRTHCGNHPYLIQLVCKRLLELGDLEETLEQVGVDQMVRYFFAVDFDMLTEVEKKTLRAVARESTSTSSSIREQLDVEGSILDSSLFKLERLGYLRRAAERRLEVVNRFFLRWLQDPERERPGDAGHGPTITRRRSTWCGECGAEVAHEVGSCPACGSPTVKLPLIDVVIPGYRIERVLGTGGMGRVFLATDEALGRSVAIKVISERLAGDEARARFLREARSLAAVEHPNIVQIFHFGEVGGQPYFVMQYVEGDSLAARIARDGPLRVGDALGIVLECVDALESAWQQGIVHRDLKPANILLDPRGAVRIADFGLAKAAAGAGAASITQGSGVMGTPDYVSPEQARGETVVDFRCDVYSLGVVTYVMLTGERPFRGQPWAVASQHVSSPLPRLRAARNEVSEELEAVVAWMTEKDLNARPASYAELRRRILGLRGG